MQDIQSEAEANGQALWKCMRDVLQDQESWDERSRRACRSGLCCNDAETALKSWLWFHRRSCGRLGMVSSLAREHADATRTTAWSSERLHVVLVALRRSAGKECTGRFGAGGIDAAQQNTADCSPQTEQELQELGLRGDIGRTEYSPFSVLWTGSWGEGEGVAMRSAKFTEHASDEPLDLWQELEGLHTRDWLVREELQVPWLVETLRSVGGRVIVSLQWLREAMQEERWGAIVTNMNRKRVPTMIASAGQQMAILQLSRRAGAERNSQPWMDPSADAIWAGRLSGLQGAVIGGFLPFGHPQRISLALTDVQMLQIYGQGCLAAASDCVVRWCAARGDFDRLSVVRTADVGSGAGTFMSACRLAIGRKMEYVFHVEPLKLCRKAHKAAWKGEGGVAFMWGDDLEAIDAMVLMGRLQIWQYSFRCRPFSHANRQAWLSEERQESARRSIQELASTLVYVRKARPQFVIIENVAAIAHLQGGAIWSTIRHVLQGAGEYEWFMQEFGAAELPEALCDRERMWIVGVCCE